MEFNVTPIQIFLIRAGLGIFFGILLSRIFYPQASLAAVVILCVVLIGLSYASAYFRNRQKK